jgi:hypothetical protein
VTSPLNKPVRRLGALPVYGRPLVVTLYPGDIIGVRQARTRTEYTVPLGWVYSMAVKAEVARKKAERAALKKLKGRRS